MRRANMSLEQWLTEARTLLVWIPIYGALTIVMAVVTQLVGMPWWAALIGLLSIPYALMWVSLRRKVERLSALLPYNEPSP